MIDDLVTCLVTTSPSIKHPDTSIIEETVASIRWHLPQAQILIACDGVRKEQESYRERYSQFVLRMEELCLSKWTNVRLWIEPEWVHQAQLIARAMQEIKTPLVLFTEHDQKLLPEFIPWTALATLISDQRVKLIRFMLEDEIKPEWDHLMLGTLWTLGTLAPTFLTKTIQWSQRTHIASVEYYREMLSKHLKLGDRSYLEDRLYGLEDEWEDHKLTIFTPPNPRRIVHLDGRGEDQKFDSVLE